MQFKGCRLDVHDLSAGLIKLIVQVGDRVKSGETLCVIEAMKMINEVPSPVSGIVKEVLIKNATMVEFDEPLFAIEETTV